ncbi:hypothetical protein SAMN05192549_105177 [Duganella sacchari]|uniref:Uncharacterized protein n=1 Tax=Duganella sacchari TaxID=551987 RepID=A0A1M7PKN6_9BURK|nr:hypothetical protein [Duganella sacchari]SHN17796.1 hypothetical protein SAMN05192549_105177 [Duganella sacchari]
MQPLSTDEDYLPALLRDIALLDSEATLVQLHAAAQQHAGDARPLLLLAAEYAQARAYDQAEGAYISALRRDPGLAIARFQLGLLQLSSGRPAAASATWAPLAALPEDNALRRFKTGLEALAEDRFADAAQWLRAGMMVNHSNPMLNTDMQRFLDAIARIGQTAAVTAETASEAEEDADTSHFLVSAYTRLQ